MKERWEKWEIEKEVNVMGYTMMMDARESKQGKYYVIQINNMEAKEKNKFAPEITVNTLNQLLEEEYKIEIQTTGYGNLTLEEYPEFLEATQKSYIVAQELQEILNQYIENN